jgi:UDP-glucose 4-epimerase
VGRGIKTTIKELTEIMLKICGSDLPIQYESAGQTFVTNRVGDPEAAARDLGFKWTVDLAEGMQKLIEWRKHHLAAGRRSEINQN